MGRLFILLILTSLWPSLLCTFAHCLFFKTTKLCKYDIIAGSLEAAYSLNWGAREIWGKGGGETLALL